MAELVLLDWYKDWIGRNSVRQQDAGKVEPYKAITQAATAVALVFAPELVAALAEDAPAQAVLITRLVLLALLLGQAHYIVVAKTASPDRAYRFREGDRWTSRMVAPLALGLMIVLSWPAPRSCVLRVTISGYVLGEHAFVLVSGAGETSRFPLFDGETFVEVSPSQKTNWRLKLFGPDGELLTLQDVEGCPDEKTEITLPRGGLLQLVPE